MKIKNIIEKRSDGNRMSIVLHMVLEESEKNDLEIFLLSGESLLFYPKKKQTKNNIATYQLACFDIEHKRLRVGKMMPVLDRKNLPNTGLFIKKTTHFHQVKKSSITSLKNDVKLYYFDEFEWVEKK